MTAGQRESLYLSLARASGLLLIVVCVLFQRRGVMHWSELVFLGACIGMQEVFVRVHGLKRLRTPMMVFYSLMPLVLVLYHSALIRSQQGDFVRIVLLTPLPLVLVSVQIMVLYVRESARLVSVVLVLALFSTVIGVRRNLPDAVWPWLAAICASGTLFLMLQHPGMLFHGVYVSRRKGVLPPAGRPGGIMRAAYFSVLPLFSCTVLLVSLFFYVTLPRLEAQQVEDAAYQVGIDPANPLTPGPADTGRGTRNRNNPNTPDPSAPATISGLASGVDLGDFGEIQRSQAAALRVRLVDPATGSLTRVYLRAFTYGAFNGSRWEPLPPGAGLEEVPAGTLRNFPGAPGFNRQLHERRVFHVEVKDAGLGERGQIPLPTEPIALRAYADPAWYEPASGTARAPQIKPGDSYEVVCNQVMKSDDQLAVLLGNSRVSPSTRAEYLQVPPRLRAEIERRMNLSDERLFDRFGQIARGQNSGGDSRRGVYAAARGIVSMFRVAKNPDGTRAWTYSLDFRPKPGDDAIARFLDTNSPDAERFGHCEYFASAMCLLLRCYGVPARVVAGFLAMTPNAQGVFDVRAANAHAWVEVYFQGWGWLAFDPTPAESTDVASGEEPLPPPNPNLPAFTELENVGEEGAALAGPAGDDWLRRYDRQTQQEIFGGVGDFFDELEDDLSGMLSGFTAWMPDVLPRSPIVRTLILVLPPLVTLGVLLWRRRKRKRIEAKVLEQMGEGGRRRERGLYFQLLLLLARYGFQKRSSETPREFATRVLRRGGTQHMPIRELTELYYGLRFGRATGLEADFRRALEKYADALRAQEPSASSGPEAGPQPG